MDNSRMMETEEGEEEAEQLEEMRPRFFAIEREDITESEEGEEEAEQLEEMKPPVLISWMGPDGTTVHGIMCIDDGIVRLKNRCRFDDCSICYKPPTSHGNHQICCLPCGHMYGLSCIKRWLLQSSPTGRCPQCNTLCSSEDAILLYPPPLCVTPHQKASSSATLFPFTKQGFHEFDKYEFSRMLDAQFLRADDITHMNILVNKHNDLVYCETALTRQWNNLLTLAEESEALGLADALRRRASSLKPRIDALVRRTDALKRLVSALRRRIDALGQRNDAYESRVRFYLKMYKEHHKAKHALERKEKLPEKAAANAKKKGEEEAEKAAEKKLKDE